MARFKAKSTPETTAVTKQGSQDAFRETVESIVVAFVLAFLFRTFIAEAFVIPTGSMAPTLFGRHKDVVCEQCGQSYEVGASVEMNDEGTLLERRITRSTCPNCRYVSPVESLNAYKGDRILVNKFPYEISEPQRWDVCVFKFPEDPERNYIKRMIGLPGETIRIQRGDVYARQGNDAGFHILRKDDPNKQNAIQILVSDDTHPPRELLKQGWPERWAGMQPSQQESDLGGWLNAPQAVTADTQKRTYQMQADDWTWLRYRHYVPTSLDWNAALENQPPTPNPLPQLITDYYAYNTFDGLGSDRDLFWVGDLTISGECQVGEITGPQPALLLELVKGVRRYHCEIDLKTGEATLSHTDDLNSDGPPVVLGNASTKIRGSGSYRFDFANVDNRLCLWVNGRLVSFGDKGNYLPPALPDPQAADLSPIGLAARGCQATFSQLLVKRDIYYRAEQVANDDRGPYPDRLASGEGVSDIVGHQLREALSQPAEYARLYNTKAGPVEFSALGHDEFFVMGDNSPQSQDSRLWTNRRKAENRHAVPRNAFVGKAFLIYWPHGIPFMNGGKGYPIAMNTRGNNVVENYPAYTFPFYPQFGRLLKRIR